MRSAGSPAAPIRPTSNQRLATIGTGWMTVVKVPASALTPPDIAGIASGLFGPAVRVSGPWGSGKLIRASLINVLMTGNTIYAGAVGPGVLYAAAASHG